MNKKNLIIISLNEDISEIIDLADSLNYKTIETFIQKRNNPDVFHHTTFSPCDAFKGVKTSGLPLIRRTMTTESPAASHHQLR